MSNLIRINKREARKLFHTGTPFLVADANAGEYHVLGGAHVGVWVTPSEWKGRDTLFGAFIPPFDDMVCAFTGKMRRNLGRRLAYYVVREETQ